MGILRSPIFPFFPKRIVPFYLFSNFFFSFETQKWQVHYKEAVAWVVGEQVTHAAPRPANQGILPGPGHDHKTKEGKAKPTPATLVLSL